MKLAACCRLCSLGPLCSWPFSSGRAWLPLASPPRPLVFLFSFALGLRMQSTLDAAFFGALHLDSATYLASPVCLGSLFDDDFRLIQSPIAPSDLVQQTPQSLRSSRSSPGIFDANQHTHRRKENALSIQDARRQMQTQVRLSQDWRNTSSDGWLSTRCHLCLVARPHRGCCSRSCPPSC